MTLCLKKFFILSLVVSVHVHGFGQRHDVAITFYRAGESFAKHKDSGKAFESFKDAMKLARENKTWDVYLLSVNGLASLNLNQEDKEDKVFGWLKEN